MGSADLISTLYYIRLYIEVTGQYQASVAAFLGKKPWTQSRPSGKVWRFGEEKKISTVAGN